VIGTLAVIGLLIPHTIISDYSEALQYKLSPLESLSETPTAEQVKLAVSYVAKKYLIEESELMTVIKCESDFKYNAVGDGGASYGIAQFQKPTWDIFGCKGDYHSAKDQLVCMAESWKKNLQRHWTCWSTYFSN
jgi:hypothetical protein